MKKITLYTRVECCLCDDVKAVLDEVRATEPFELEIVDVDRDPAAYALYTNEVPVVAIDGRKAFKFRVTAAELREKLARRPARG